VLDSGLRDERTITDRLRNLASIPPGSPVILGIGGDCAIYRPHGSADDLLFTADTGDMNGNAHDKGPWWDWA
jgi:hypothetical protein